MLDTVLDAITQTLSDAGIDAVREYPGIRLGRVESPVVCLGARSAKLSGSGMGDYMGLAGQEEREVYALRLELCVGAEIFAPVDYRGGCIGVFEKISTLLPLLPSGIRPTELVCGDTAPDSDTGLLKCGAELHCTAALICELGEETGQFTDFRLKGVLTK